MDQLAANQAAIIPLAMNYVVGVSDIESRTLEEFTYRVRSQVLEVVFRTGAVYRYYNVPLAVAIGLWNAVLLKESVGSYFSHYVRDVYQYQQL